MPQLSPIKKQSAYIDLLDSLNDMLLVLPTKNDVNFPDSKWSFENSRGYDEVLDFSFFSAQNFPNWTENTVHFQNKNITLNIEEYAKLLFLHMNNHSVAAHKYRDLLYVLKVFFYYLQSVDIRRLDKEHAVDFYSTLINFDLVSNKLIRRLSTPSYKSRLSYFNEKTLFPIISRFKADVLVERKLLSSSSSLKNDACIATMDITLRDYIEGDSFNYLGLEVGKHYVDHCANIFQKHSTYASACRKILSNLYDRPDSNIRKSHLIICTSLMMGIAPAEISILKKYKEDTFSGFIADIKRKFIAEFNLIAPLNCLTDISLINELLSELKLHERYDNQEFIRSLLFTLLEGNPIKSFDSHLEEYRSFLKDNSIILKLSNEEIKNIVNSKLQSNQVKESDFYSICSEHYKDLTKLTPDTSAKGVQLLQYTLSTVEASGTTLFVALTGWRRSEYGFPLTSINSTLNPEPSDNAYTPYRVHVKWIVPKTSDETKLDREITFGSYLLAKQMHILALAQAGDPCLYSFNHNQEKDKGHSEGAISRAVNKAWFKFPFEYQLFKDLENKKKGYLDDDTKVLLSEMAKKLQEDHLRFAFFYLRPDGLDTPAKKIDAFKNGTLPEKFAKAIQTYLSEETLDFLMKSDSYSRGTILSFRDEILGESLRPTPHAFRHMWAEAVLLRYRGNVGKFIRANFKHLDEGFFMAYLRGKETKVVMNIAKRAVISLIVREQMSAARKNNSAYVGGFERFISKAARITSVLSHDEYLEKAENIANQRILDIKTNPWTTCMLRKGTLNSAKCSDGGTPQRYNASPKLCLGCTNGNISEGNFNGIVVYIKSDIDACRHPRLPYFVKQDSVSTLLTAMKRVAELNEKRHNLKYVRFIDHMKESIKLAEATRMEELRNAYK